MGKPEALVDAETWTPPVLDPLPDTTGWTTAQLETLALARCRARKDTQQAKGTMACRRCLQEVLTGKDPLASRDLGTILRNLPLPERAGPAHRELLAILAAGGKHNLARLKEITDRSETDCSARLRDLRQFGYPINRAMEGGQPVYWLGI